MTVHSLVVALQTGSTRPPVVGGELALALCALVWRRWQPRQTLSAGDGGAVPKRSVEGDRS